MRSNFNGKVPQQRTQAPARHEDVPQGPATDRVNILLVDDRVENLVTLEAILEQPDLRIVRADSGKQALRCLLQEEFAAILLDVNMPEMDGFETAALIRQRKSSARTPIIFVTAFSDEHHVIKGYSLGAVDYILTPVQPDVLRAKVAVFVDLFRKTAEIQRQSELLAQAEQKLRRRAERALADSEERFRVTFNQAAVGMALIAPTGSWVDVNEKFCDIVGCTRDELQNCVVTDLITVDPDQHADPFSFEGETTAVEAWCQGASGRRIWLHLATSVVRSLDGEPKYIIAVLEDITARREAEQQLKRLNDELEQRVAQRSEELRLSHERLRRSERLASLGTLAAGIAHEINNPINAILLTAQYTLEVREESPPEVTVDSLDSIIREARRCGAIVKNVLQFSREEKARKEMVGLNELVSRAAALLKTYVDAPQLQLDVELSPDLPPLMLNPTQIEQVLVNLVQNAVQAASGRRVCVRLATQRRKDQVRLTVRDDGPGIPPASIPHIFDPFYSTRQGQGGTGLGLSIAHGIVTDHGGTIDVRSELGKGTSFILQFPIPAGEPSGLAEGPATARVAPRPDTGRAALTLPKGSL